ncbi:MAG: GNAT family N-acetyltransferase [Methylophilaceae bacterium]
MTLKVDLADSVTSLDRQSWDALVGGMPLLSHAFLSALEESKSIGNGTGWQSCPMLVFDDEALVGGLPLYVKSHSYGEYVFDWAWAEAYEKNGLNYYPKLIAAIPFSPVTSQRLLVASVPNASEIQSLMVETLEEITHSNQFSGAHVLFPNEDSAKVLSEANWLQRHGVQFQWKNESFENFEGFLSQLTQEKRKKIRQERKKVVNSGVVCHRVKGPDISEAQWEFFYQCYCNTYREHRSTPYLTREFFKIIAKTMTQHILLVMAYKDGAPIASALNFYDQNTLYGRYWGCLEYVPNLHFELCYYQAQEFCIAENIQYFEGGAQGEHKLARGFKPKATCSFHQIAHPQFANAIEDFVMREAHGIAKYTNELEDRAPFKLSTSE